MEELNGVTIYWLVSIGLLAGYFIEMILGKRGMNLAGNLIGGVIGAVVIGVSAILLGLYGPLLFAAVGVVAFLFLVNVFNIDPSHKESAGFSKE